MVCVSAPCEGAEEWELGCRVTSCTNILLAGTPTLLLSWPRTFNMMLDDKLNYPDRMNIYIYTRFSLARAHQSNQCTK